MSRERTPVDDAHWGGIMAETGNDPIESNPFKPDDSVTLYWAWRIGWLWSHEQAEWESSDQGRAEQLLQEQPSWERREELGVNELVRRVTVRAETLAKWLVSPAILPLLEDSRRLLRESVDDLLDIRNEQERRESAA